MADAQPNHPLRVERPDRPDRMESTEAERVTEWRTLRLLTAGFPQGEAVLLAESGADIHRAEAMLAQGCSAQLVYRILR